MTIIVGDFSDRGKDLLKMKKTLRDERKNKSKNQKVLELLDKQQYKAYGYIAR